MNTKKIAAIAVFAALTTALNPEKGIVNATFEHPS